MAATLFRTFYINWLEKRFQLSNTNGGELVFTNLNKYESIPFKFIIVQPDSDYITYSVVPIDNLALTVSINDTYDDSTPLASQSSWTKDLTDNSFYGELDLNTSGMNTYMGSAGDVKNPLMSIILSEGTARSVIWLNTIQVKGSILPPTYTSPDPLLRYLTADELDAQYVKFINAPGRQITLTSPLNLKQEIFGVTDGGTSIQTILDVV